MLQFYKWSRPCPRPHHGLHFNEEASKYNKTTLFLSFQCLHSNVLSMWWLHLFTVLSCLLGEQEILEASLFWLFKSNSVMPTLVLVPQVSVFVFALTFKKTIWETDTLLSFCTCTFTWRLLLQLLYKKMPGLHQMINRYTFSPFSLLSISMGVS